MNTKLTATIAIAVVAMMVFSTAGATTLSWFTDTEETDITITTGSLDVSTSKFYVGSSDNEKIYESDNVPSEFSIEYDGDRAGVTKWENKKLVIAGDPDNVNVIIKYKVTFSGDVDYKYFIGVDYYSGIGVEVTAKDANDADVVVGSWIKPDETPTESFSFTHDVSIKITSLPEDLNEANNGFIKIRNMITQYMDPSNPPVLDSWDSTVDCSWYNDSETEFILETSEQFAGLATLIDGGNAFEGKTVKLSSDLNLLKLDENGEPICFEPIGSYRYNTPFKGTFDGQGHTISNLYQNTWALNNGYYYGDLGMGLFGKVEDATIKNLVMDGASISGESAICGTVAAAAYGDCTFENITISNSNVADYQYYAGGIVGWASGNHEYINCHIDASTTIAAQWGDFDNSIGGVIGGAGGSAKILLKDCTVECRIDAYNDVTSANQWYAYRRAGMLIGNTGETVDVKGTTYASAPQLTCENVTVIYGDWANYTYCEFAGKSWPYVRVQDGISNGPYSNPRYGHPTDANGNTVVNDNHVHNDGEDHNILCEFDQLYGGGQGVYGDPTHDGVTVIYNNK